MRPYSVRFWVTSTAVPERTRRPSPFWRSSPRPHRQDSSPHGFRLSVRGPGRCELDVPLVRQSVSVPRKSSPRAGGALLRQLSVGSPVPGPPAACRPAALGSTVRTTSLVSRRSFFKIMESGAEHLDNVTLRPWCLCLIVATGFIYRSASQALHLLKC